MIRATSESLEVHYDWRGVRWRRGRCASCGMDSERTARFVHGGTYSLRLCESHANRAQHMMCERCRCPVGLWNRGGADFWKHHGGRGRRGCGQAMPILYLREEDEALAASEEEGK